MTKTVEEVAKRYAEDMCPIGDYCGGVYDEQRNIDLPIYIDDAKSVLRWLFDKPLSDRLTAEEKERVRTKYNAAKIGATEFDSPECADLMDILEDIFGANFFKEGE